jgi:hypothetical protein
MSNFDISYSPFMTLYLFLKYGIRVNVMEIFYIVVKHDPKH